MRLTHAGENALCSRSSAVRGKKENIQKYGSSNQTAIEVELQGGEKNKGEQTSYRTVKPPSIYVSLSFSEVSLNVPSFAHARTHTHTKSSLHLLPVDKVL